MTRVTINLNDATTEQYAAQVLSIVGVVQRRRLSRSKTSELRHDFLAGNPNCQTF